jgi:multiple sugar transport system permease protein
MLLYVVILMLLIPFVFPLWWMITSSVKPIPEVFAFPPTLWPQSPQWGTYGQVFELQPFARQFFNSFYIATIVTTGVLLISSMAGYAFARIRFRGQNVIFLLLLSALLMPREVVIIPLFEQMRLLGFIDTHWPLILIPMFGAQSVFGTFLMRQFFLGLPKELEEAGRMDGLGRFGIFRRIALPLAKPSLAALTIITFLQTWDLFLEPLVFLSSPELFTLPLALTQFTDAYGGPVWNVQMAATTMTTLPVLLVFILAQRHFVQGIAQTGLKG